MPSRASGLEYTPLPRWTGGHWMTLYAWARRRSFPRLPPPDARRFRVAADAVVLTHCHWQPVRTSAPTLVTFHGLEGSSSAHYMRGMAEKAFALGFNVVRVNQRNCGGTENLSRGLYHSGLTEDPIRILEELADEGLDRFAIAGYSLGGNLALKLAGDYGDRPPSWLRAVSAVSPTMDLACCVDALERRENAVYQWNFVRNLKGRMRRKAAAFPDDYDLACLKGVRTVRQFDDALTAPHHGFRDAADYYYRASAARVIDRVRVPTLILASRDDPFVPAAQFEVDAVRQNPSVTVVLTAHGGHCGFVETARDGDDGYWAERRIVEFAARHTLPGGVAFTQSPPPVHLSG